MGQWTSINSGTSVDLHKIKFADSLNGYILGYHQTQNQRIILKYLKSLSKIIALLSD